MNESHCPRARRLLRRPIIVITTATIGIKGDVLTAQPGENIQHSASSGHRLLLCPHCEPGRIMLCRRGRRRARRPNRLVRGGKTIREFPIGSRVTALAVDKNGHLLAAAELNSWITLWEVESGREYFSAPSLSPRPSASIAVANRYSWALWKASSRCETFEPVN